MIQEAINFIWLVILFGIFWVVASIGHELFHGLACVLQGCKFEIKVWWFNLGRIKLPSMKTIPLGELKNQDLFYYLGGIGLGTTFVMLSLIFYFIYVPFFIVLLIIGSMHFWYGAYEGSHIRTMNIDDYMRIHYFIYLAGFALGFFMTITQIINYVW